MQKAIRKLTTLTVCMIFLFLMSACGNGSEDTYAGDWHLSRVENINAEEPENIESFTAEEYGARDWAITINEDGTAVFRMPQNGYDMKAAMHWTVENDTITFSFDNHDLYDFDLLGKVENKELVLNIIDFFNLIYVR